VGESLKIGPKGTTKGQQHNPQCPGVLSLKDFQVDSAFTSSFTSGCALRFGFFDGALPITLQ
jgi:hypothetical protein